MREHLHQHQEQVQEPAGVRMLRRAAITTFCSLLAVVAVAQERGRVFPYQWPTGIPREEITTADVQQALAWTGHYDGMADGGYGPYTRKAVQSWLSKKGYPIADTLTDTQALQLLSEGLGERDKYGWAELTDEAVGFSVGLPASLSELRPPQRNGTMLQYFAQGRVSLTVSVQPETNACSAMDAMYNAVLNLKTNRSDYKARKDDWFVVAGDDQVGHFYLRAQCRQQAIVAAVMKMANGEDLSFLYVAFSNSLRLRPTLNPFAMPQPRIVKPALRYTPGMVSTAPQPAPAPNTNIDRSGKTATLNLSLSDGSELRPQEVFARASRAVYVVDAPTALGSAVAISERELLTNCHVLQGSLSAGLVRDDIRQTAYLISANQDSDRCILGVTRPLPSWVKIRPYADVKVGERVYTIGSPKGLELTLADGIVSSKRTVRGGKFIQTSAPISSGSSGGGLFDAQGNLIGITTFMLRDSQNLNFAIAAEEYAK